MTKLQNDVETLKKNGEKFDTYKMAKSYNVGRLIIALLLVVAVVLILMNL